MPYSLRDVILPGEIRMLPARLADHMTDRRSDSQYIRELSCIDDDDRAKTSGEDLLLRNFFEECRRSIRRDTDETDEHDWEVVQPNTPQEISRVEEDRGVLGALEVEDA